MKGQSPECLYKPAVWSINSNFLRPVVMFEFSCFSWEQCLAVQKQLSSVRTHMRCLRIELRHDEWANYNFIERVFPCIQSKFISLLGNFFSCIQSKFILYWKIFLYIYSKFIFYWKFFSNIFNLNLFFIGNFFSYIQSYFIFIGIFSHVFSLHLFFIGKFSYIFILNLFFIGNFF